MKKNDIYDFVKKAYDIIRDKAIDLDFDTTRYRMELVKKLEAILNTQFTNTRDFNLKVGNFIRNQEIKQKPVTARLKKIRKKFNWTQKEMAKQLGFKSHVTINNYEKGLRYPPKKILIWLERQEELTGENVTEATM